MEEILDIYDKNGVLLGQKIRSECHKPNVDFYHKAVWVWIFNEKNEILIQQRSLSKKIRPGCWLETSVGGHVVSGENLDLACEREIFEELGIKPTNLKYVQKYIFEKGKEIVYLYTAHTDKKISQLTLQEEEVAGAQYISIKEYIEKLSNNFFGEYQKDYINIVTNILTKEMGENCEKH